MAHCLSTIWANYIISPDPSSGTPSLHDACLALTKHSLQPVDIVSLGAGFTLHPELAQPAARHHFGESSFYIGSNLPQVLTGALPVDLQAPQCQIISHWVMLLDKLETAMRELKNYCVGDPHARSRHEWSSPYPRLVASLSPILLGKLRPCNFEWWGMPVPGAVRDAAEHARSETSCTSNVDVGQQLPASEVRSATPAVSPPDRFPCAEAASATVTTSAILRLSVPKSAQPTVSYRESSPVAVRSLVTDSVSKQEVIQGSNHTPVAALPAAVKDPPYTVEIGGLEQNSQGRVEYIASLQSHGSLTARNWDKGQTLRTPRAEESASQLHGLRTPSLCGSQAPVRSPSRVSKLVERFKAITTGGGAQSQASASHPDDAVPRPRLPYAAKAKMVEIGGLGRQQATVKCPAGAQDVRLLTTEAIVRMTERAALPSSTRAPSVPPARVATGHAEQIAWRATETRHRQAANAGAEQVFTFSERGDAQSPAPALVFDEPAVERGGLSDLLSANGQQHAEVSVKAVLTSEDGSNPSRIASTDVSAPLPAPNSVLPSITDDKTFALVSAIVRTYWIFYLGTSLGGASTPCLAWAWEGIGTPAWI
ncbi:hypothetical protein B0H14DRAFT_2633026 [Mycena olivaceomarginata]|nr:hypothetical protein B0H14DRAFT_2633026 [Mycena olivaceomarginata]